MIGLEGGGLGRIMGDYQGTSLDGVQDGSNQNDLLKKGWSLEVELGGDEAA